MATGFDESPASEQVRPLLRVKLVAGTSWWYLLMIVARNLVCFVDSRLIISLILLPLGIDSYYEYLLKAYILFGDESYLRRFNRHYEGK